MHIQGRQCFREVVNRRDFMDRYVPAEIREPEIEAPKIKNPPILGYTGE